jgi:membrane protein
VWWGGSILFLRISQEHFSSTQRIYAELKPVVALLLWLYFTGAAIFIGGEINSEIEKAATETGDTDVRKPGDRRSGGTRLDADVS